MNWYEYEYSAFWTEEEGGALMLLSSQPRLEYGRYSTKYSFVLDWYEFHRPAKGVTVRIFSRELFIVTSRHVPHTELVRKLGSKLQYSYAG